MFFIFPARAVIESMLSRPSLSVIASMHVNQHQSWSIWFNKVN